MKRHWIIEDRFLGTSPAAYRRVHEQFTSPIGYHFFCTHCGKLWASCPVDNARHMVWAAACSACQVDNPPNGIPGSLWLSWEPEFREEMPEAVIHRELLLHLAYAASRYPEPVASAARNLYNCLK